MFSDRQTARFPSAVDFSGKGQQARGSFGSTVLPCHASRNSLTASRARASVANGFDFVPGSVSLPLFSSFGARVVPNRAPGRNKLLIRQSIFRHCLLALPHGHATKEG